MDEASTRIGCGNRAEVESQRPRSLDSSVDIKVAHDLLRHASGRTTLDIYTRSISEQKQDANGKVVAMMLPEELKQFSIPRTVAGIRGCTLVPVTHRDRTDDPFHAIPNLGF